MIQCDYVCGWANDGENRFSHGWLELGEVIIDITADQFDGGDKVIVSAMSAFHSQFEVSQRFPSVLPTNGDATDDTVADLRHDFELIKATLRKGGCKW